MHFCITSSLDINGYDNTEEGAWDSFHYAFGEYLKDHADRASLEADLQLHGWRNGEAPSFHELMQRYPHFREIIEAA